MFAFLLAGIHKISQALSSQIISLVCLTPFKVILSLHNRLLQKGLFRLDWAPASYPSQNNLAASIPLNEFQATSMSTASRLSTLAFLRMVFRQNFPKVSTAQAVILTGEKYAQRQRTVMNTFNFLVWIQSYGPGPCTLFSLIPGEILKHLDITTARQSTSEVLFWLSFNLINI